LKLTQNKHYNKRPQLISTSKPQIPKCKILQS